MFDTSHRKRIGPIGSLGPKAIAGFKALDQAALADRVIPIKYKELMAIAEALTMRRPRCIKAHRKASRLRLPAGTELHSTAGANGCRAWIKTGHLAHDQAAPTAAA